MEIQRAIGILKEHNQYRRGVSDKMTDPTVLGDAIDYIVNDYQMFKAKKRKAVCLRNYIHEESLERFEEGDIAWEDITYFTVGDLHYVSEGYSEEHWKVIDNE